MLEQVVKGRHPLTEEGIVLTPVSGKGTPIKVMARPEADVKIQRVFDSKADGRAGGFEYSSPGSNKVLGRVGTGFSHETLKAMLARPEDFEGRVARISFKERFDSGAYRAPAFKALHEG